MKRSLLVDIIAGWASPEILHDVYSNNYKEWADNFLHTLENELGFKRVEVLRDDYTSAYLEEVPYEPEEGWDAYFAEADKKDNARDFYIIEGSTLRSGEIARAFLNGKSFEELADEYNVTRERIRQIVAKQRRRYQRHIEGKNDE
jgi:Mor family transcriptional regulator